MLIGASEVHFSVLEIATSGFALLAMTYFSFTFAPIHLRKASKSSVIASQCA